MKLTALIILLFISFSFTMRAQYLHGTIDTVISYQWGDGQNSGQSSEFFPQNIFGPPDTSAREDFQSADPKQICSIGLGGEIIVGFKGMDIVDGPGPDFTVFENAFFNPVTNRIFAEPAQISVSEDGIKWIAFPFDSVTLKGCAGITPIHGNEDPLNPAVSGGDKFDLSDLGLMKVRYIKIKDTCRLLLNNPKLPYYDPIISGFDLDAVVGLHLRYQQQTASLNDGTDDEQIIQMGKMLRIQTKDEFSGEMINILGQIILTINGNGIEEIELSSLPKGLYIMKYRSNHSTIIKKIIIE